jgi:hypothetical protein
VVPASDSGVGAIVVFPGVGSVVRVGVVCSGVLYVHQF